MITTASGACCLMLSQMPLMIWPFLPSRSRRVMPGLRGRPAVTMTRSAPAISA